MKKIIKATLRELGRAFLVAVIMLGLTSAGLVVAGGFGPESAQGIGSTFPGTLTVNKLAVLGTGTALTSTFASAGGWGTMTLAGDATGIGATTLLISPATGNSLGSRALVATSGRSFGAIGATGATITGAQGAAGGGAGGEFVGGLGETTTIGGAGLQATGGASTSGNGGNGLVGIGGASGGIGGDFTPGTNGAAIRVNGYPAFTFGTATAGTTQTQAGATVLSKTFNKVTTGNINDGVALPSGTFPGCVFISNISAVLLKVYGNNSDNDTIDGGAVDAAVTQAGTFREIWYCTTDGVAWTSGN